MSDDRAREMVERLENPVPHELSDGQIVADEGDLLLLCRLALIADDLERRSRDRMRGRGGFCPCDLCKISREIRGAGMIPQKIDDVEWGRKTGFGFLTTKHGRPYLAKREEEGS